MIVQGTKCRIINFKMIDCGCVTAGNTVKNNILKFGQKPNFT